MAQFNNGSTNRTRLRQRCRAWFGTLNYARRQGGVALRGFRAVSVTRRMGGDMIRSLHVSVVPGVAEAGWRVLPADATEEEFAAFMAYRPEPSDTPPRVSRPNPFWRAWLRATHAR